MRYLLVVPVIALCIVATNAAYAHFFGATKTIDSYQVIFQPTPSLPVAGDNSTQLNFSVLQNGSNIYNAYFALVISEKSSGAPVEQFSYRQYEFSDITIPYTFQRTNPIVVPYGHYTYQFTFSEPGRHTVYIDLNDQSYSGQVLTFTFFVNVAGPFDYLYVVVPSVAVAAGAAGAVMVIRKKKKSWQMSMK